MQSTRIDIADHHKDQLLMVLMYYLDQETRAKLAREVPAAYNAICGREVARVMHTDRRSCKVDDESLNIPW